MGIRLIKVMTVIIFIFSMFFSSWANNISVWGKEPVTQVLKSSAIRVETKNDLKSSTCNTLFTKYRIYNISNHPIKSSTLKIRYYYTVDNDRPQVFFCDWTNVDARNISGTFVELNDILVPGREPAVKIVNIISPVNNSVINKPKVDIVGKIYGDYNNVIVEINHFQSKADQSGNFVIKNVPLGAGRNALKVKASAGDTFLGTDKVYVTCDLAEASKSIDVQTGGRVEVTKSESEILGAAIDIPGGALECPIRAKIAYNPDEIPSLKLGENVVGPVVIFNPIGQKFKKEVTLTLPVKSDLLPNGANIDDIYVYGLSDSGLTKMPVISRTTKAVQVKVNSLEYGYFVPVAARPSFQRCLSPHSCFLPKRIVCFANYTWEKRKFCQI